ncbi:MAG: Ig-like domain-containing protein [Bacteroidota bacterium]|nr:Ig-like domain-containing protein [Bacteroidota bacterium]
MSRSFLFLFIFISFLIIITTGLFSCANIIPPSGGPRDSLPPVLIKATPNDSSVHFNTNKITLNFDEYVTIDNPQDNIIVWPNPVKQPTIESKLRTVTIKLRDSLEKNTTYTILFGKGLKDVNEGNADTSFNYVFTTGSKLDKNVIRGKVILAETGKIDTTLLVVLQTNLSDTAIKKIAPRYYARLNRGGNFRFFNLPADTFNIFVVPNDYTKRYDDSTKMFAYLNKPLYVKDTSTAPVTLYAFEEYKPKDKSITANTSKNVTTNSSKASAKRKRNKDSTLKVTADFENGKQDFLKPLTLTFSDTLQSFDTGKIHLTDTLYQQMNGLHFSQDSTLTKLIINYKWKENTIYKLIIEKDAASDSLGKTITKNDTLSFSTLRESDYGSLRINFQNVDTSKHPVLLLLQNEKIVESAPITSYQWYQKYIRPGEYEMRVLFDTNRNGKWDAGSYEKKTQPEVVESVKTISRANKINLRGNWDNEENVSL